MSCSVLQCRLKNQSLKRIIFFFAVMSLVPEGRPRKICRICLLMSVVFQQELSIIGGFSCWNVVLLTDESRQYLVSVSIADGRPFLSFAEVCKGLNPASLCKERAPEIVAR